MLFESIVEFITLAAILTPIGLLAVVIILNIELFLIKTPLLLLVKIPINPI